MTHTLKTGITEYNDSITYMKAIGIILMVFMHCTSNFPNLRCFIYMFHMPLFFFIAGYCFKKSYLNAPSVFIRKKIKSIWWPCAKYCGIFALLHNIFISLHIYTTKDIPGAIPVVVFSTDDLWVHFQQSLMMFYIEQLQGGNWFLSALFWGLILAFALLKLFSKYKYGSILSAIIALVSIWPLNNAKPYMVYIPIYSQTFAATFIILCGYIFSFYKVKTIPLAYSILPIIITIIGSKWCFMELCFQYYKGYYWGVYLLISVIAVWGLYSIIYRIKDINFPSRIKHGIQQILKYIGNNTLTILIWHFSVFKLVSLLIILIYDLPIERLAEFPIINEYASKGWWVAYFLTSMIITSCIAYLNKFIRSSWLKL